LHSSDPITVVLSVHARVRAADVKAIDHDLYEERAAIRMLGMRRTMFVVPVDLVPVVHAAATQALVPRERKRLIDVVEQAGVATDGAPWLRRVEEATYRAIVARGEAAAAELGKDVPELRAQVVYGEGKTWAGSMGLSTRVLWILAMEGRIVRTRPRGSWISSQYRWAPMESWVPGGVGSITVEEARRQLVRRWLEAFGPATAADVTWWTGWNRREVARVLDGLPVVEVALDGGETGYVLAGDEAPAPAVAPWVALLPGLDPTAMGWAGRGWYLGEHRAALFDRSGNIGPTVWSDGRIVGGWAQRKDGEVVYRLLEDVGSEVASAVEEAAAGLTAWLDPVCVTPRFRTPLERELTA
jgi:Winged helix DNA-binding domain